MAIVDRRFRDNFEAWAAMRQASGAMSADDVEELRVILRKDLTPGPDTVRAGVQVIVDGHMVSGEIPDRDERYRLWDEYFQTELEETREGSR